MTFEMILSIASSAVIFLCALLRLNTLRASRPRLSWNAALEVVGLALVLAGSIGMIAEWFVANLDFFSDSVLVLGCALFAIAITRGQLPALAAQLHGWDGTERRRMRAATEFIEKRFQRTR